MQFTPPIALPVAEDTRPSTEVPGKDTGIRCQLLNDIDETEASRLIQTSGWCAQEELDGRRLLLRYSGNVVTAIDRQGRQVEAPAGFILAALGLGPRFLLDGEAEGDTYHAFDLLELDGRDLRPLPLRRRLDALSDLLHGKDHWAIKQVPTARLRWEKETMFETFRGERRKGIVFKHLGEPYRPGRQDVGDGPRKLSFVPSASFIVAGHNGKRSVTVELLDEDRRVSFGKIAIPQEQSIPSIGTVLEASYLASSPGGTKLRRLTYVRRREDIDPEECRTEQLRLTPR